MMIIIIIFRNCIVSGALGVSTSKREEHEGKESEMICGRLSFLFVFDTILAKSTLTAIAQIPMMVVTRSPTPLRTHHGLENLMDGGASFDRLESLVVSHMFIVVDIKCMPGTQLNCLPACRPPFNFS